MARDNGLKLEVGSLYKKIDDGCYYYRYQVKGERKAVSLKTRDRREALAKAKTLVPVVKATTVEAISAHVKSARGLSGERKTLMLSESWEVYARHPERAAPATVNEQEAYRETFLDLVRFVDDKAMTLADVTAVVADRYEKTLRARNFSVTTHNRKIKRLKKIFTVLREYWEGDNPFAAKSLRRKEREEQGREVKRLAFTRAQEDALLKVLEDDHYQLMNKAEIRVIYHLGMFTGQRLKDCVLLRWDNVDLNRRRIQVRQFKTGKNVTIPIATKLLGVLLDAQSWKRDNYVCPNSAERYSKTDAIGQTTGGTYVNRDALRVIKWIGLEPSVKAPGRNRKVTVYGFHSLRHSFASHCAEAGVPKAVVLSILGTNSEIVDKYYTHIGEEAQEKAIMAITGDFAPTSDRERINKVLALIDRQSKKSEIVRDIEKLLR